MGVSNGFPGTCKENKQNRKMSWEGMYREKIYEQE